MKITVDIPDNSKCANVCVLYGDLPDIKVMSVTLGTREMVDGNMYKIQAYQPKDGEQE